MTNESKDRPGAAGPAGGVTEVSVANAPGTDGPKGGKAATGPAMNGADFQLYIGRGLRAVFDDVAKQPVPDRFLELMKKLG